MVLIILIILSLLETTINYKSNVLFTLVFIIISTLNIFRFGIGSDYFNYLYLYQLYPSINSPQIFNNEFHGEIGFKILAGILKYFNFNYTHFTIIISSVMFLMIYIFIKKYSKYKNLSLLMFYVMYYFTYFNSGFRQGFTITLFLLVLLPLLLEKKLLKFYIITIILSLFHSSVLVVLILPLIQKFKSKTMLQSIFFISIISLVLSIIVKNNIFIFAIQKIGVSLNYTEYSLSILAILYRLSMLVIIVYMYKLSDKALSEKDMLLLYFYFIGFCVYIMLSTQDLLASRIHVYFKVLEIYMVPKLLSHLKLRDRIVFATVLITCIIPIFYVKEINAQIYQAKLIGIENFLQYKYVSIFNKQEVFRFRLIPSYIENILN
ncbi:EpsG family protein [Vagococcus lutrae]|uniref:EpsG family protein n=1 Tax=Vagococcus lutrae TaxID=81947 RepID=UPI003B847130